ncbi:hypothetical protein K0U00_24775 [Paenibacillus sepulcri]|uniref:Uncharacterized protein n=1 Tax=Paenibacillus sepulcri TaxID=359917 RepID=A0ABS7C8K6_9BACL|nr:hypothetical protein [Paenibacillus sepulcri]
MDTGRCSTVFPCYRGNGELAGDGSYLEEGYSVLERINGGYWPLQYGFSLL